MNVFGETCKRLFGIDVGFGGGAERAPIPK